jgi:hypothetical protein
MASSKPMRSTGLGERSLSGSPAAFETSRARKLHAPVGRSLRADDVVAIQHGAVAWGILQALCDEGDRSYGSGLIPRSCQSV